MTKHKEGARLLRLTGSIMLLLLGFTMLVSDVVYRTGATITTSDAVSTVTYNTAVFDNYYVAFTIILLSIALIIKTSVELYEQRYEETEEQEI